jgi:hypothetical protein
LCPRTTTHISIPRYYLYIYTNVREREREK